MSNTPFDPSKFTVPKAKPLPVILLLDVSASMSGDKIRNLNDAVRDMLDTFRGSESSETEIWVSIITFGSQVNLHQSLASAGDIQWQALSASGTTPLGVALDMAKAMIEDKDVVPSRAYRPTVVLVSDGQPDSGWKEPLDRFVSDGRSAKCDRMAIAIGVDADKAVLGQFIEGTQNNLFYAENAKQLRDRFKFVTMSVVIRTKSQAPNTLPAASEIEDRQASLEPRPQNTSDDDGGYW
ncbi:VWA domain-containing protein [Pseudomonas viridiflava]|uniref:vWA domain-containing protein n=1 Tax=Pseudomonas viridiflava TaxID=33069 RepID=UPI000BBDC02C|nr:VWA domain-containing protein [Pseudomonas viridiflava]PCK92892.1 VWA domain-containing protein [Pseudomonas viridiflava]